MTDTVESLILDLLEWVGRKERTYQETMEAWRTSCPRLPLWEDANDRGLVATGFENGRSVVRVTPAGVVLLRKRGRRCLWHGKSRALRLRRFAKRIALLRSG